jgi:hypothetical protein
MGGKIVGSLSAIIVLPDSGEPMRRMLWAERPYGQLRYRGIKGKRQLGAVLKGKKGAG